MAEGSGHPLRLPDNTIGGVRRHRLTVVEGGADAARPSSARPLIAPARLPFVLSASADFLGIGRTGWIAAAVCYTAVIGLVALQMTSTAPPQPLPMTQTTFAVIFEPPPPPPAPIEEPPPPPPEPQAAAVEPAPAPPPPEPVVAEPPPPSPVGTLAPVDLPSPPPPKPKHIVAASEPQATPVLTNLAPAAAPPVPREQQVAVAPAPVPAPVLPPRAISGVAGNPKPVYPPEARRRRAQGIVVLKVDVAASGAPLAVTVRTSSGHAVLDEAARDAVERWRFNPAIQAGVPVAGTVDVPVQFRLEE